MAISFGNNAWRNKVKVMFSRYNPSRPLEIRKVKASCFFSSFRTVKVVRSSPLRTGRLYPQEFSWYSFLEAESTPGHMVLSVASKKYPATLLGIDPENLRLVAQWRIHDATTRPHGDRRENNSL
jgi:hypothetical protein